MTLHAPRSDAPRSDAPRSHSPRSHGWQTMDEAAHRAKVSSATIGRWRRLGLIPHRIRNGRILVKLSRHFEPPAGFETAKEGAWRLRLKIGVIHHWGASGKVPVHRINKRVIYYDLSFPPVAQGRWKKLDPQAVAQIRELHAGGLSCYALARRFRVTRSTIDWHRRRRQPIQKAA